MVDMITRLWDAFCHVYAVDLDIRKRPIPSRMNAHVFLRHGTHRFAEFGSIGAPNKPVRSRYPEMESEQLTTISTEDSVYGCRGNELHIDLCCPRYELQSIL